MHCACVSVCVFVCQNRVLPKPLKCAQFCAAAAANLMPLRSPVHDRARIFIKLPCTHQLHHFWLARAPHDTGALPAQVAAKTNKI